MVFLGQCHEGIFACSTSSILSLPGVVVNSGVESDTLGLGVVKSFEEHEKRSSTTDGDLIDTVSSGLNSDQERTVFELRDLFEDSDCSIKDTDYVPDAFSSDEELREGKF